MTNRFRVALLLAAGFASFLAADLLPQDRPEANRIPNRGRCRSLVSARPFIKGLKQIPSTVIDKGILAHVPYISYRAGDYELNIYGDPASPAGVEIGIYGDLIHDDTAKRRCIDIMIALFPHPEDRKLIGTLDRRVDKKTFAGLVFEITPHTAEDAYDGWWISVYDEASLERSRATPEELAAITVTRTDVKRVDAEKKAAEDEAPLSVDPLTEGRWGSDDLRDARNRKDVPEERQAVYKPSYIRKDGKYVPDRSYEDTGVIMFVCANSDRHEDREEILRRCRACNRDSTFFWDSDLSGFVCFQCGVAFDKAHLKCSGCGQAPRRVRTKRP